MQGTGGSTTARHFVSWVGGGVSASWILHPALGHLGGFAAYLNMSCVYQKISGFWRSMLSTLRNVIEETLMSAIFSGQ